MTNKKNCIEIDVQTGERIERNLTESELADLKEISTSGAKQMAEFQAKAAEKQALLDRLGITADEAKLLLG
jgi:hypothetical protein